MISFCRKCFLLLSLVQSRNKIEWWLIRISLVVFVIPIVRTTARRKKRLDPSTCMVKRVADDNKCPSNQSSCKTSIANGYRPIKCNNCSIQKWLFFFSRRLPSHGCRCLRCITRRISFFISFCFTRPCLCFVLDFIRLHLETQEQLDFSPRISLGSLCPDVLWSCLTNYAICSTTTCLKVKIQSKEKRREDHGLKGLGILANNQSIQKNKIKNSILNSRMLLG